MPNFIESLFIISYFFTGIGSVLFELILLWTSKERLAKISTFKLVDVKTCSYGPFIHINYDNNVNSLYILFIAFQNV